MKINLAIAALAAVVGASCGSGPDLTDENFYSDLSAAEQDGAIERGWIPDNLPPSSREIREFHDLDSGASWITFTVDGKELSEYVRSCVDGTGSVIVDERSRKRVSWWPAALASADTAMDAGFTALICTSDDDGSTYSIFVKEEEGSVWRRSG